MKKLDLQIERNLLKLSLPMLAGMIFELVCTLLDMFWIARIDPANTAIVSGVGLVNPIAFLLVALAQGVAAGISTIAAISAGRGDAEDIRRTGGTGFNLSLYASLTITLLAYAFAPGIIGLLAGDGLSLPCREYAQEYLAYYMPGIPFLFCGQALMAVQQGKGNTKHVGIALSLSTTVNALLDPVFVFVLGLGVKGAAITTSIGQVLFFAYAAIVSIKKEGPARLRDLAKMNLSIVKRILKLGIPQSVSFIILSASFAVVNWFVGSVSETFMQAYTIVARYDGLLLTPTLAFSIGLSVLVGQTYGGGEVGSLRRMLRRGTALNMLISLLTGVAYMLVAKPLFGTMSDNPEVLDLALKQVYWLTLINTAGSVLGLSAGSALQAVEKPVHSTFIMLLRMLLITAPAIAILQFIFGISAEGVWISVAAGSLLGGFAGYGMAFGRFGKMAREGRPPDAEPPAGSFISH